MTSAVTGGMHCTRIPVQTTRTRSYVVGEAVLESADAEIRAGFLAERGWTETAPPDWHSQQAFELLIERVLYTKTTGHADFNPVHTVWRSA